MAEVSGNVLGMAVANGSKQWRGTRAAEDSDGGGGIFVGCEKSVYRTIILHCVKPQQRKLFCVGKEGQTLRYIIR